MEPKARESKTIQISLAERSVHPKVISLMRYQPLCEGIEKFWLDPARRKNAT
jgi:hypothetical protein